MATCAAMEVYQRGGRCADSDMQAQLRDAAGTGGLNSSLGRSRIVPGDNPHFVQDHRHGNSTIVAARDAPTMADKECADFRPHVKMSIGLSCLAIVTRRPFGK